MAKTVQVAIRVDEEEKDKLDQLCEATVRNQSDMVRYLIRKEWDQMFGGLEPSNGVSNGHHEGGPIGND